MAAGLYAGKTKHQLLLSACFSSQSKSLTVTILVEKMRDSITFPERILEPDALAGAPALVARRIGGKSVLLVCDDATWVAAGQELQRLFIAEDYHCVPHSLGRSPQAEIKHIPALLDAGREVEAILAIGSGTINDLVKYAAHQLNKPYICVATAASMNGYTSATVSLLMDEHKQSILASPPIAVLGDLSVISHAPRKMARAGLGDTLCRATVEADSLISHIVRGTPYEDKLFEKLRRHEAWLMHNVYQIKEHSFDYLRHLMEALLDGGDAMHEAGSSVVASQGEHMIGHTMEMLYEGELRYVLHGELIAIASTTMAQLQHKILHTVPQVKLLAREAAQFNRVFGKRLGPQLAIEYSKKLLDEDQVANANARLTAEWEDIKASLLAIMPPASTLERVFKLAGMATTAKQIGFHEERYKSAVNYAHMTRDRFTFLDLSAMNIRLSW
jgi:glycerol-1-phosphate dehydrogenase [NAD(P)+]